MESGTVCRPAVGVHGHGGIRVRVVADTGPLVNARTDSVVVRPGQDNGGTPSTQQHGRPVDHVESERMFGISGVGLRTDRVAFLLDTTGENLATDHRGRLRVTPVVAGVEKDGASAQRVRPGRRRRSGRGRDRTLGQPGRIGAHRMDRKGHDRDQRNNNEGRHERSPPNRHLPLSRLGRGDTRGGIRPHSLPLSYSPPLSSSPSPTGAVTKSMRRSTAPSRPTSMSV